MLEAQDAVKAGPCWSGGVGSDRNLETFPAVDVWNAVDERAVRSEQVEVVLGLQLVRFLPSVSLSFLYLLLVLLIFLLADL